MRRQKLRHFSGVYVIENAITGRFYVGSSKDVPRRWRAHRIDLRKDRHGNSRMLADYREHGADAFRLRVVAELPIEQAREMEQRMLSESVGSPDCYNIARFADCGLRGHIPGPEQTRASAVTRTGMTRSPEARARIAAAGAKRRGVPLSPDRRAQSVDALSRAREAVKERGHWNVGNPRGHRLTPDDIVRLGAARRGKKRKPLSPEVYARRVEALRALAQRPDWQEKMRNPERLRRLSEAARAQWADPERRAILLAARAESLARRMNEGRRQG